MSLTNNCVQGLRAASDNGTAIWMECEQEAGDVLCVAEQQELETLFLAAHHRIAAPFLATVLCGACSQLAKNVQVRAM